MPRSMHHSMAAPPSPTLSATTHVSSMLGDTSLAPSIIVTRADMRNSLQAYQGLLSASKAYTSAMLAMSEASAHLASSLEACARVKGAHQAGSSLQAAAGLHHLLANSQSLLADVLWRDVSIPLLEHFDAYRSATAERQVAHEATIREKSRLLNETEARNMRTAKRKERDLNSFRRALAELQQQVETLDEIKADYYHEVLQSEEEVWSFIQDKVSHLLRSQLEIHERIASKGLSDPILESLLSAVPDPFSAYGPPKSEDQIFSVLPPGSLGGILSPGGSSSSGDGPSGVRSPNILSPSTPAKGLPRAGRSAVAGALQQGQSGEASIASGLGIAVTSDLPPSKSSATLFGSEESGTDIFTQAASSRSANSSSSSNSATAAAVSQATRLKHALSIIDEDAAQAGLARGATPVDEEEEEAEHAPSEDKEEEHVKLTGGQVAEAEQALPDEPQNDDERASTDAETSRDSSDK